MRPHDDAEWFEKLTYGDLLDRAAERFGDRTCLTFEDREWSFREVRERVDEVARGLIALGVGRDDVVAVWLPNRPEWIFIQLAVARVGAVLLPVNAMLRESDCAYILEHSDSTTLFIAEQSGPVSYIGMVNRMAPDLASSDRDDLELERFPALEQIVTMDAQDPSPGCYGWSEFLASGEDVDPAVLDECRAQTSPDEIATIMYTSGTTGTPKGVTHSHHAIRNVVDQANRLNVRMSDVILMYLPLFHAYALYEGPLLSLVTGARCVLMDRFDADRALRRLESEQVTLCFGFATHFQDMLESPAFDEVDRSSLRAGIMAVGPKSVEELARRVQRSFGGSIVSGYGMTEIGVGATLGFLDEDEDHSAATSGYPLSGYEFRIIHPDTGEICEPGEIGEVLIRSYQVTEGYFKEPERTAETIDDDGWLHSGDMGVLWDDGYLRILGRYKDMLRVGGENVDPAEVESLYQSHDAVGSAVLVGVPDRRLEEVGCICIVPAPGVAVTEQLEDELLHLPDDKLASYKRPRYVHIVESFPQTASGKVQRHELREVALDQLDLDTVSA